eukprot:TRINITY_DN19742_c0_g2_i1.p1 TRINITY_DN19742_c0_g2~~TRINITY_DN19742_c0_g2_i1.p1  ORF type:complete len:134 (-),score=12.62 TRINITY_DN19742_c0_g2_i1:700-1101(-)
MVDDNESSVSSSPLSFSPKCSLRFCLLDWILVRGQFLGSPNPPPISPCLFCLPHILYTIPHQLELELKIDPPGFNNRLFIPPEPSSSPYLAAPEALINHLDRTPSLLSDPICRTSPPTRSNISDPNPCSVISN